jgi:hypothetical protein
MIKRYIYLGYRLPDVDGCELRRGTVDYTIGRVYAVDLSRYHHPSIRGVVRDDDCAERVFFKEDFAEVPE